ncbi:hypothetical protein BDF14DRAFT_1075846 [Spinellus fusiger]|nr:hypothetical protein BDF14DRAFT_1075846 [Spinellus fusiger]
MLYHPIYTRILVIQETLELHVQGATHSYIYQAHPSEFGNRWAHNVQQKAVIIESQNFHGCQAYTDEEKELIKGKLLIVYRSFCTFHHKVLMAEQAKATAVLFVNNVYDATPFKTFEHLQADTSTRTVHTPSAMISLEQGTDLIQRIKEDNAQLDWTIRTVKGKDKFIYTMLRVYGKKVHNVMIIGDS